MKSNIKKIASALLLIAVSGGAQAQLSNTLYFNHHNFRSNQVNPAFMPEGKCYISGFFIPGLSGFVGVGGGNNSLSFDDVIKKVPVNGRDKTVFVLDKAVKNGQQQLLDAIGSSMSIDGSAKATVVDFGFRVAKKNFFTISAGVNVDAYAFMPKSFFSIVLDGVNYHETFDFDIKKLGVSAAAYADLSLGYTRVVNDKLSIGAKFKYLKGAAVKTDFSNLDITASADEWQMHGDFEVMVPLMGAAELVNEDGHFKEAVKTDDYNFKASQLSSGLAMDLGFKYSPFERLHLSASVLDLGYINVKDASKLRMKKDFSFEGFEFDIDNQDLKTNFDEEFNDALISENGISFKHKLTTKVYAGAEFDLLKAISVGALSKTSFIGNHVWEEASVSLNLHPIRFINLSLLYNIYDHQKNTASAGVNLNLGAFGIFVAMDNLPLSYGQSGDFKRIPLYTQYMRFNFGMGWNFGCKNKNKKKKDEEESEEGSESSDEADSDFYDADADGVEDMKDRCADTPEGVEVDSHGCPLDDDKDGVPNYLDTCADTPEDVQVDEKGCPVDSDKDGIADYLDKCPGTPEGMPVDASGCPIDEDHDGVADALDKCPDTPAGVKVKSDGCPVDTDGDGVPDYLDQCPEVAGDKNNNGCPVVKKEIEQLFRRALNGIQFETGKSTILKSSYPILDEIAKTMIQNPTYKLNIYGHTDNVGNPIQNLQLSKDRAASVAKYIIGKNISADRIFSEGFGDTKPLVPNTNSANRAKNRRVEFEVEFMSTVPQE